MKKYILSVLVVLISFCTLHAQPAGWAYEKPFAVTNSSSQLLLNYTIGITVNTQALIAAHQMQDSGQDIRFGTPCTGTKIFNDYIFSGINTTTTLIYVQIDSLKPNSTLTIYMFYGKSTATATSSLSALDGPYTMFNGQDLSLTGSFGFTCCSLTDTTRAGVLFQPNQQLVVSSLGVFVDFDFDPVLLQLSSYSSPTATGNVIANIGTPSNPPIDGWEFVDLPNPIPIYPGSYYVVSVALDNDFWDYFTTSSIPPYSPQVNIAGYAENFYTFPFPPLATTAPIPTVASLIAGFADIRYYITPVQNSSVTYIADSVINGSAFYDPKDTLVCPGNAASFTAQASGALNTYQWQVNTGSGWTNLSTGGPYSGVNSKTLSISPAAATMNGYQYRAYMTSTCGTGYSNPATLHENLNPAILPIVTIAGPNPACAYTNALYTLTTNVGAGARYSWARNGNTIGGATGTSYAFAPNNGDVIQAMVLPPNNAALGCYIDPQAVSNAVTIRIGSNFTPYDSIAASNNNSCAGTIVDFTGYGNVYGGTYQWYVNGQPYPGATASLFSYAPTNGDQVTEVVYTPQNGCYSLTSATSQPVVATTAYGVTATINLVGPTTAVDGNNITLTANVLNYGTGYTIIWSNAGVAFDTTTNVNTILFKKSPSPEIDYISARIYPVSPSNNTCYNPATSNTLVIGFTPYNVGVNNVANNNNISVYPNPFTSTVSVSGLATGDMLEVYDMTGRKVGMPYKASTTTAEYTPGGLAAGHYILRVTDADGAVKANLPMSKL